MTGRDRLFLVRLPIGPGPARPRPVWPGPATGAGVVESRLLAMGIDGGDVDPERNRSSAMAPPESSGPAIPEVGLAVVLAWDAELWRGLRSP